MTCKICRAVNGCVYGYRLEGNPYTYCIVLGDLECKDYGKLNPEECQIFQTAKQLGIKREDFRFHEEIREFRFKIPDRMTQPELWSKRLALLRKLERIMMEHMVSKMKSSGEYGWKKAKHKEVKQQ